MSSIEETFRVIIREELAALKFNGQAPAEDHLLMAAEAAELLKVSEAWLYKYADKLPYTVKLADNVIRFSHNKIQAEIQRQLKARAKV